MSSIEPQHAYTVTTARVMPPAPPTKPAAYAARMAQHIAMGRTPAQAMAAIERADGHMGRIPPNLNTDNCGGRGHLRGTNTSPLRPRIMAALTSEWQAVTPEFVAIIGGDRKRIWDALADMRAMGKVQHLRAVVGQRAMWRLA